MTWRQHLDDTIIEDTSSAGGRWRDAVAEHVRTTEVQNLLDAIFAVRGWYWSDPDRHRVGRQDLNATSTWIVEEALRRVGREPELARTIAHRYRELREHGEALLAGVIAAIERLREQDIRLALLTNG